MGEAVAKLLRQAGSQLIVVGRNAERVREIADTMQGTPRSFAELGTTLVDADVVVTTTSAPGFIVDRAEVEKIRRARRGRNLFFIDLAVPRDVDPRVNALDGVFLYNVDDLSNVVAQTVESRRREADQAERIVQEEADSLDRWAEAEQATPTIVALRERFRSLLQTELDRSLSGKLRHLGPGDREALAVMIEAAVNKMLHQLTARLRRLAVDPGSRTDLELTVSALQELFELESVEPAGKSDPAAVEDAIVEATEAVQRGILRIG
jgi:glutamyl-tRNA reductase